jgi:hypothetical protein
MRSIVQGPAGFHASGGWSTNTVVPYDPSTSVPVTLAFLGMWGGSITNYPSFYGFSNGSLYSGYCAIIPYSTNQLGFNVNHNTGGNELLLNLGTLVVGQPFLAVCTIRSATDHEAWAVNLATGAITTGTSSINLNAVNQVVDREGIGYASYNGATSNYLDGYTGAAWMWNRGFSSAELKDFLAQPWDMVVPASRFVRGASLSSGGGAAALEGVATGAGVAVGGLTTGIRLAGVGTGSGTAAGALTTSIEFASAQAGSGTATGALATAIRLAVAPAAAGMAAGALTTGIALAGAATGTGIAVGALGGTAAALQGAASGTGAATAALTTGIALAGAATGAGTATGAMAGTAAALAGAATGSAGAAATLTTGIALAGNATGAGVAVGAITTGGGLALAATATGTGTAAGTLSTGIRLVGVMAGSGTATGALGGADLPLIAEARRTVRAQIHPAWPAIVMPPAPRVPIGRMPRA